MIVKLPKETEEHIQRLVDSGEFADREAVLVQAVDNLMRRHLQTKQLQAFLRPSIEQVQRGETVKLTQELLDQKWESALEQYFASTARNDRAAT